MSCPPRLMWNLAWLALVAVTLVPAKAWGDGIDDHTLAKIAKEVESELQIHRGHHQHLRRHHRHHHNPFLHRHIAILAQEEPRQPIQKTPSSPQDLPLHRHPAVAKKLRAMGKEIHDLTRRQHIAEQTRGNLEGELKEAVKHMNDVVAIKSEMAHAEVQIRNEERKLKQLEDDRLRLDRTHNSLLSSLRHIMKPKIEFAKSRLQNKKEELARMKAKVARLNDEEKRFHSESLAMLEQRDNSEAHVQRAIAAEAKAHEEWKLAEKELKQAKKNTNLDIEGYRYSKAEAEASKTQQKQSEQDERDAEVSVRRLIHILEMEQHRVDESMAIGKDRVQGKIQKLEKDKRKSSARHEKLKQEYAKWQKLTHKWSDQLQSTKYSAAAAAQKYAKSQKTVLDAASEQVVADAESDSDWAWDDWANE